MKSTSTSQRGAVSLFVVIFAMLIITVLTMSFLRLMISDQTQATNANLAEGARNSALAGTEDAKRALLRYLSYCQSNSQSDCEALETQLTSNVCNQVVRVGDVVPASAESGGTTGQPGEIKVQQTQSTNDALLDQAYTCVTLALNTTDYLGSVSAQSSHIVPLRGVGAFDRVQLEWFSRDDVSSTNAEATIDLPSMANRSMAVNWPSNRPPVMRTQLMQVGASYTFDSFDTTTASGQSNTNTLFLFPTSNAAPGDQSFTARDTRRTSTADETPADSSTDTPLGVRCQATLSSGGYACTTMLVLPEPVGSSDGGATRTAYLRLTALYGATHFRVTLYNGGLLNPILFKAVQPEIDATGRANNVFKRIATRVDLFGGAGVGATSPAAAVQVSNNFCKDFAVTDYEYVAGACTP